MKMESKPINTIARYKSYIDLASQYTGSIGYDVNALFRGEKITRPEDEKYQRKYDKAQEKSDKDLLMTEYMDRLKQIAEAMEYIMKKNKTKTDAIYFRVIGPPFAKKVVPNTKIILKGFTSVSTNADYIQHNMKHWFNSKNVKILVLYVKKGTPMFPIDRLCGDKGQCEIVFPRDMQMEILSCQGIYYFGSLTMVG